MAEAQVVVRVVELGRSIRRIPCAPGATLASALDRAGIDVAGRDVHVNGRPADLAAPVADGDLVTVIPRVRGGTRGMHLCTIDREEIASEAATAG